MCGNTAEELFYKTRSTSGGISTLLRVLILQRTSSTREGAPVGGYLSCSVCLYCRGALLHDKEHKWEYTYAVVRVNIAEELFYKAMSTRRSISTLLGVVILQRSYTTRVTSRSIPTLLCVQILQRSSTIRQGAPVGVYLPCCVCLYCRRALLQDKEHL